MTFNIGDKVTWTSSAAGTTKTKTGTVVAIIPAYKPLDRKLRLGVDYANYKDRAHGLRQRPRNHESYLISVPTKSGRGKRRLYWPVVSLLRFVGEAAAHESDLTSEPREQEQPCT